MSVKSFSAVDNISVTPAAAAHFALQLKREQAQAVRISLRESGCTGFKYVVEAVAQPQAEDLVLKLENDVALYLDREALPALQGTEIDYALEGVNQVLKFNNPNVSDACGCGESFSFK